MCCSSIFLFAVYIILIKLELSRAPCCSYASINRPKPFAQTNELFIYSKYTGHIKEYTSNTQPNVYTSCLCCVCANFQRQKCQHICMKS